MPALVPIVGWSDESDGLCCPRAVSGVVCPRRLSRIFSARSPRVFAARLPWCDPRRSGSSNRPATTGRCPMDVYGREDGAAAGVAVCKVLCPFDQSQLSASMRALRSDEEDRDDFVVSSDHDLKYAQGARVSCLGVSRSTH